MLHLFFFSKNHYFYCLFFFIFILAKYLFFYILNLFYKNDGISVFFALFFLKFGSVFCGMIWLLFVMYYEKKIICVHANDHLYVIILNAYVDNYATIYPTTNNDPLYKIMYIGHNTIHVYKTIAIENNENNGQNDNDNQNGNNNQNDNDNENIINNNGNNIDDDDSENNDKFIKITKALKNGDVYKKIKAICYVIKFSDTIRNPLANYNYNIFSKIITKNMGDFNCNQFVILYMYYNFLSFYDTIKKNTFKIMLITLPTSLFIYLGIVDTNINVINLIMSVQLILSLFIQYVFFKKSSPINGNNWHKIVFLSLVNFVGIFMLCNLTDIKYGFVGILLTIIVLIIGSFTANLYEKKYTDKLLVNITDSVTVYFICNIFPFCWILLAMPMYMYIYKNEYNSDKFNQSIFKYSMLFSIGFSFFDYYVFKNKNSIKNYVLSTKILIQFANITMSIISLIIGTLKFDYIFLTALCLITLSICLINYVIYK